MAVTAKIEGHIGRLVLSHPPLNILTREVLAGLREGLRRLESEARLRVLLLTAEGKHFSAGADVAEHFPPRHLELIPEFLDTITGLDAFPLPVVASVRGHCLGGGFELVQAADLIVAGESAKFGQPEIALGLIPPAACALLPLRTSGGVAAQVVFTGEALSAHEAERAGLVQWVVPDEEVDGAALKLAQRISRHSAAALRVAKRALRQSAAECRTAALRHAGQMYLHETMATADALEGLRAFADKRLPAWTDK